MASSGPRARGTDGSDFLHRERVASHYQQSAELKPKLKRVLFLQAVCAVMCLTVGIVVKFDYPSLLCFSGYVCGLPMAFMALSRNKSSYIDLYGNCCSLLGMFPMVYVLYLSLWTGLMERYRYVRLCLAVTVVLANAVGMYLAKKLKNAWTATKKKN